MTARVYTPAQRRALMALTGKWGCGWQRQYCELQEFRPALVERDLHDWCISSFVVRLTPAGLAEKERIMADDQAD
jgi:hypothetical protein